MKLYQCLEYQANNRVATITLNRPEAGNALTNVMVVEWKDAMMAAEKDPEVKVIVIRAKGEHFCQGLDGSYLKQVMGYNLEQNAADSSSLAQLMLVIYRSTKVVISEIQGEVVGEGVGLVSACDFAIAAKGASFATPEVKMGLVPALPMVFLLRKIGETRSKELMLTGDAISAEAAASYDLINRAVDASVLAEEVQLVTTTSSMLEALILFTASPDNTGWVQ
ncbi:MAG: enoyl-CoA hydratase/isomerase family protein [Bacteroidota bacterium]